MASAKPPIMPMTSRRPSLTSSAKGAAPATAGASAICGSCRGGRAVLCFDDAVTDNPAAPYGFGLALRRDLHRRKPWGGGAVMRQRLIRSRGGVVPRPVQRPLLDGEQAAKRNAEADRSGDEHPVERRTEIAVAGSEPVERHGRAVADSAEHDGAEHRHHDGAAERAEE